MKYAHLVLILLAGYLLGVYFPAIGQSAISKVQSVV